MKFDFVGHIEAYIFPLSILFNNDICSITKYDYFIEKNNKNVH